MADHFTKLQRMTAATAEPQLTNAELEDLLSSFATADSNDALPSAPEWIPTYNLRAAAREGWKIKLARAAEAVSTDLDGDRMSANQLFDHCERMVKRYSGATSVSVGPAATE